MTIKDFFRLLIKVFGLYLFISLLYQFLQSFAPLLFQFEFGYILILIGIIALSVAILIILFTKGDQIIDFLKLDKGFDQEEMNISGVTKEQIITFAVIILGGMLIADNFPEFIYQSFLAFKEQITPEDESIISNRSLYPVNYYMWYKSLATAVAGYLLITNHQRVTRWLIKKDTEM